MKLRSIPTILFFLSFFGSLNVSAQVGIGTTSPNAQLDIQASNQATPANTDGILIPKVDEYPASNPTALQDGMLIYATGAGAPAKGFYYWDNALTAWVPFGGGGTVEKIDDLLDGKSDSDGTDDGSSVFLGLNAGATDDSSNNQNVGIGFQALTSNSTGFQNVALGAYTLQANTTGIDNTATGFEALKLNTTANGNTAYGYQALTSNTTGAYNTATGWSALRNNTGNYNIAIGASALYSNTTGINNIAVGVNALSANTTGASNSAIGLESLKTNTYGNGNTALGYFALKYNNSPGSNTAVGYGALYFSDTGWGNVAVGSEALKNNYTGLYNTAIGYQSGNALNNAGSNNIIIGALTQVPLAANSNQVQIGNGSILYAGITVPWTVTSDRRWKKQIRPLPYGLNMIEKLTPVDYTRKNNEAQTREIGFIAQDLKEVLQALNYDDQGLLTTDDQGYMSVRYNDFIPVLVKAVQEQQQIIAEQQKLIEALQREKGKQELIISQSQETNKNIEARLLKLEALISQ